MNRFRESLASAPASPRRANAAAAPAPRPKAPSPARAPPPAATPARRRPGRMSRLRAPSRHVPAGSGRSCAESPAPAARRKNPPRPERQRLSAIDMRKRPLSAFASQETGFRPVVARLRGWLPSPRRLPQQQAACQREFAFRPWRKDEGRRRLPASDAPQTALKKGASSTGDPAQAPSPRPLAPCPAPIFSKLRAHPAPIAKL